MAEVKQISFDYKEVAESLLKTRNIHQGLWSIYIRFGLHAVNMGPSNADLRPSAVASVIEIGLQKSDEENNLTVDAAHVNPKP